MPQKSHEREQLWQIELVHLKLHFGTTKSVVRFANILQPKDTCQANPKIWQLLGKGVTYHSYLEDKIVELQRRSVLRQVFGAYVAG